MDPLPRLKPESFTERLAVLHHHSERTMNNTALSAPSSTNETAAQLPAAFHLGLTVFLAALSLACLAGNGTVLALYARCKSLRTVTNLFLMNVCVADLLVGLAGVPLALASSAAGRWLFGDSGCLWYALISSISGCSQIVGIAMVALHRFFMVVKPITAKRLSFAGALACIGTGWLYSIAVASPPAFGWSEFTYEGTGISCSVNWQFGSRSYTFFIFAMILAIPLSVIVASYGGILMVVRQVASKTLSHGQGTRRAERKVTIMVLVMVVAFLVAWGPYAALALYSVYGDASSVSPRLATVPCMFAKTSAVYNSLIYFLLHDKFRAALLMHSCIRPTGKTQTTNAWQRV